MTIKPTRTPEAIRIIAEAGGLALSEDSAARVARAVGPALEAFAPIPRDLPFEAEPATFNKIQRREPRP